MYVVKTNHCINVPNGKLVYFYVADGQCFVSNNELHFVGVDLTLLPQTWFDEFDNFPLSYFISLDRLRDVYQQVLGYFPEKHYKFWGDALNSDTSNIIKEVVDSQVFCKKFFGLNLPEQWNKLDVEPIINNLHIRLVDWIRSCVDSLRILATNDTERAKADKVRDAAYKLDKFRDFHTPKPTTPTKELTLKELIDAIANQTNIDRDKLIQAIRNVYDDDFKQKQQELKRLLK